MFNLNRSHSQSTLLMRFVFLLLFVLLPGIDPAFAQSAPPLFVDSGQFLGTFGGNHVAVGDLDNDGDLDAFVFGAETGPSHIWINQGNAQGGESGRFLDSGQPLSTLASPIAGALGDLDGDQDLDAVVATCDGNGGAQSNIIWLNQGGAQGGALGVFIESDQGLDITCSRSVVLGDVDGDQDLDIFIIDWVTQSFPGTAGGRNRLWLNQGGLQQGAPGTFLDSQQGLGSVAGYAAAMGDLDDDHDLDIFIATDDNQPDVLLLNQGGKQGGALGTFANGGVTLGRTSGRAVALADLDNDNDLDVVVTGNDMTANTLWLNQGGTQGGTPGGFLDSGQRLGDSGGQAVAVADIDGDDDIDLLITDGGPSFNRILLNQGGEQGGVLGSFQEAGELACDTGCTSLALGDLDNDNDLDIFFVGGSHAVPAKVLLNQIGNAFSATPNALTMANYADNGTLGDIDGDDDLDLIVATTSGESAVWLNQGGLQQGVSGSFIASGQTLGEVNIFGATGTVLGDLDGDHDLDAVVGSGDRGNQIWVNQGGSQSGTLGIFANAGQNLGVSRWPTALGDVDGDDDLDVIVIEKLLSRVWLNQGGLQKGVAGTFVDSGQQLTAPYGDTWRALALGDLDNDGDLDALIDTTIWLNQGGRQHGVAGIFRSQGNIFAGSSFDIKFAADALLGDFDGDGDLDLFVTTIPGNFLFTNEGKGQQGTPGVFKLREQYSGLIGYYNVAMGDVDGDGDLDIWAAKNRDPHIVLVNQGGAQGGASGEFTQQMLTSTITGDSFVALGDLDNDGDVDAVADTLPVPGANADTLHIFFNKSNQANRLHLTVKSPAPTHAAPFRSTPVVLNETVVSIPFTLSHPQAQPIGRVAGYFSTDGGGHWRPAVADNELTNLRATPAGSAHHFAWNLFRSGLFGQADNVLFRLVAYEQPLPITQSSANMTANGVPNLYLYPQVSATSLPFRLRGTQIRVLAADPAGNLVGVPGATVYALPKGQTKAARPLNDALITNNFGFLPGTGAINLGDQLMALLPITATENFTLYHTSPIFVSSVLTPFVVTAPGVQPLVVSAQHPLYLFNLDVVIEWDARNDSQFLQDLKDNLLESSRVLYDWSNGQAALGEITIYHNKERWQEADVRIYATVRLHPSATIGGSTPNLRFETITKSSGITQTLLFGKGFVRMGPTWNKYGEIGENNESDWALTLAHELSHYFFYLLDNYIGFDENQRVINVRGCPGAMSNPYFEADGEYHPALGWEACLHTLSHQIWGRADWATMQHFYPALITPTVPLTDFSQAGPALLPLAVTQITEVRTSDTANGLQDPTFFLLNEAGKTYFATTQARAYLLRKGMTQLIDLGTPRRDRISGWGAHADDILCVYDLAQIPLPMTQCEPVKTLSPYVKLAPQPNWRPNVLITPLSAFTLSVAVNNVAPNVSLVARLYIANGISQTVSSAVVPLHDDDQDGVYTGVVASDQFAQEAYLYLYNEQKPAQGIIIDYTLGGAPTLSLSGGSTLSLSGGSVIHFRDGRVQEVPAGSTLSISAGSILFLSRQGLTLSLSGGSTLSLSGGSTLSLSGGSTLSLSGGSVLAFPNGETLFLSGGSTLSLSGGSTLSLSGGSTLSLSGGSTPIRSSDGQVTLYTDSLNFAWDEYYIVQGVSVMPAPPLWATSVGNAYRIVPSATLTEPLVADISYQYLGRDVAPEHEASLRIYRYDGAQWRALPQTDVDPEHNVAVARTEGAGIYALMYSIGQRLVGGVWNPLHYPLQEMRPLTPTLSVIEGKYTLVYGYDPTKAALERWSFFSANGPAYLNSLTELRPGPGYWIWATEDVDLLLKDDAAAQAATLPPLFPAIYYGALTSATGDPIPPDLPVQAHIGNTLCGVGRTQRFNQQTVYVVAVYSDDGSATANCGAPGRTVQLTIGDLQASTTVPWQNEAPTVAPLALAPTTPVAPMPSNRIYLPLVQQ